LLLGHAETRLTSATTGLLVAITPLLAIVIAAGVGIERLRRERAWGLGVGLVGVLALVGWDIDLSNLPAVGAVVLAALGYAIGPMIISRKLAGAPPIGVIAAALTIASLVYAPGAAIVWPAQWTVEAGASIVVLGVLCTGLAFVLFFSLIAEAGPARATVITYINPAVAVGLGAAILHEPINPGMLLGFPLVIAGSVLATRGARDHPTPTVGAPTVRAAEVVR
jgi:drug/metabolite transporter (DMT)-like permease